MLLLAGMAGCIGGEEAPTDEAIEGQTAGDPQTTEAPGSVDEAQDTAEEPAADPAEATNEEAQETAGDARDQAPVLEPYRFSHRALDLTIVEEGSFGPGETCSTSDGPTCRTVVKDLTSLLPATAPVQIDARATYTTATSARLHVEIHAPTGTTYDVGSGFHQESQEPGVSKITTSAHSTLVAGGQEVSVEVSPRTPEPAQPLDFTLTIELTGTETNLPVGVPIEVPIREPHQPLRIERVADATADARSEAAEADGGADVAALMIWDPADRFVDHVTVPVPGPLEINTSMAGDHVLLLGPSSAEDLRLMAPASASDQRLRALAHTFERGPVHEVLPEQPATWTFEPGRVPMSAGVFANGSHLDAANANWEVALTSPAGELVEASRQGGELWLYPEDHTLYWFSSWADPALVPGAYEAYAGGIYSGPAQVGEILVHYVR